MDLSRIPLFSAMKDRMRWLGERHTVLAQNIANADTPDFQAMDLKTVDFGALVTKFFNRLQLARTDPGHFGVGYRSKLIVEEKETKPYEVSPTGNSVVLEEQMLNVAETAMDYQLTTNLYGKHVGMIRSVLGRGA